VLAPQFALPIHPAKHVMVSPMLRCAPSFPSFVLQSAMMCETHLQGPPGAAQRTARSDVSRDMERAHNPAVNVKENNHMLAMSR
jgi:hypothetical protein